MTATIRRGGAASAARRSSTVRVADRRVAARVHQAPKPKVQPTPKNKVGANSVVAVRQGLVRPRFGVVLMLLALAAFAVVGTYAYLAQMQFRVHTLQSQRAEEQRKYEQLRLEVAGLTAPERIVTSAQRLGMITPQEVTYLQVTEPLPSASDPTAEVLSEGWRNVKGDLARSR
ncbi:MAG: hypothetical protein ACOYN3_07640 [Acidimicrobiia bacterium]